MTIEWLWLVGGLVLGALALWFIMSRQVAAGRLREEALDESLAKAKDEAADFRRKAHEGKQTIKGLRDSATAGDRAVAKLAEAQESHQASVTELEELLAVRDRTIRNLRDEVGEREETIKELRDALPSKKEDGRGESPAAQTAAPVSAPAAPSGADEAAKAAEEAAAARKQAAKAEEKATKLEADLASSRETNRQLNQRATELKAAINRLEQSFLQRNRKIGELEKALADRDDAGTLIAPAAPAEGPSPDDEKLANERLVLAYKRDMASREERIKELRKQISQRDRKISQLLDEARGEQPAAKSAKSKPSEKREEREAQPAGKGQEPAQIGDAAVAEAGERIVEDAAAVDAQAPGVAAAADLEGDKVDAPVEVAASAPDALAVDGEVAEVESDPRAAIATPEAKMAQLAQQGEPIDREPVEAVAPETALPEADVDEALFEARPKDKLTRIKGIGPVFERRLNAAGIQHFSALAELSPDRIRELVEAKDWQAASIPSWIEQAREMAGEG